MSYPAPSPSSCETHLTFDARSDRPAALSRAISERQTISSPARPVFRFLRSRKAGSNLRATLSISGLLETRDSLTAGAASRKRMGDSASSWGFGSGRISNVQMPLTCASTACMSAFWKLRNGAKPEIHGSPIRSRTALMFWNFRSTDFTVLPVASDNSWYL